MGVKWLFVTMFSVLFQPERFWTDAREQLGEVNAMRDYAAPLITIAQLCKLPFIGVPRMAMLLAIFGFVIDVAVLFLLSGAIGSLAGPERSESFQQDVMTVLCYSFTPLWLAEPFALLGVWRWLLMAAALLHAVLTARFGMHALFDFDAPKIEALSRKSGVLMATAAVISFMLIGRLTHLFTSL
ncbi:MAG: hypothetical protein JW764_02990 [Chlorobiaceae bacterium]|nr:hypothetical protein [Chlorobiaceae bacterium]